jgi:membrane protease YdiL (CAAX protease family)
MSNVSSDSHFTYTPDPDYTPVPPPKLKKKPVKRPLPGTLPWGPWVAVVYALAIYILAQATATMLLVSHDWLTQSISAQFWYVLMAEALTFAAIWWFVKHRGAKLQDIGWHNLRGKDIGYAVLGFIVYFAAYAFVLGAVMHLFPSFNVDQKQDLGFSNPATNGGMLMTFISLVVLPPLIEETVFRGFVYGGLRSRLKPIFSALITSAVFASLHLEFGNGGPLVWVAALDTFTLSLVLCYLREKTDSLWPGILVHALKNGLAFVSLFVIGMH